MLPKSKAGRIPGSGSLNDLPLCPCGSGNWLCHQEVAEGASAFGDAPEEGTRGTLVLGSCAGVVDEPVSCPAGLFPRQTARSDRIVHVDWSVVRGLTRLLTHTHTYRSTYLRTKVCA